MSNLPLDLQVEYLSPEAVIEFRSSEAVWYLKDEKEEFISISQGVLTSEMPKGKLDSQMSL